MSEQPLANTKAADDLIEVMRQKYGTMGVYPYPHQVLRELGKWSRYLGSYTREELVEAAMFLVRLGVFDRPMASAVSA